MVVFYHHSDIGLVLYCHCFRIRSGSRWNWKLPQSSRQSGTLPSHIKAFPSPRCVPAIANEPVTRVTGSRPNWPATPVIQRKNPAGETKQRDVALEPPKTAGAPAATERAGRSVAGLHANDIPTTDLTRKNPNASGPQGWMMHSRGESSPNTLHSLSRHARPLVNNLLSSRLPYDKSPSPPPRPGGSKTSMSRKRVVSPTPPRSP